jgi:hypothetical protein
MKGTRLAPDFRGSSTLRSNVKHTYAVEEHGDFFGKLPGGREPLHPNARFHRRKLEIRAFAPMQKPDHVDYDHFKTLQGQVEGRKGGRFLLGERFSSQSKLTNGTPGPKYNIVEQRGGYSGYVAMSRPRDLAQNDSVPGPGQYDVSSKQTTWTSGEFGKGLGRDDDPSLKNKWAAETPGPADYSARPQRVFKSGKFEKSDRGGNERELRNSASLPGPLHYYGYEKFEEHDNIKGGIITKGFVPTSHDLKVINAAKEPAPHDYGRASMPECTPGGFIPKDQQSDWDRKLAHSASEPGPLDYQPFSDKTNETFRGGAFDKSDRMKADEAEVHITPGPSDYKVQEIRPGPHGAPFGKYSEQRNVDPLAKNAAEIPGPQDYTLPSTTSSIKAPMLSRAADYDEIRRWNDRNQPLYYDTRSSHKYLEPKNSYKMSAPSTWEPTPFVTPAPDRYKPTATTVGSFGAMRIGVGNGSFAVHFNAPAARIRSRLEPPSTDQGGGGPGVCRSDGAFGKRAHAFPPLPSPDKIIMKGSPPQSPGPTSYDVNWHSIETKLKQLMWKESAQKKAKISKARVNTWKWRQKNSGSEIIYKF